MGSFHDVFSSSNRFSTTSYPSGGEGSDGFCLVAFAHLRYIKTKRVCLSIILYHYDRTSIFQTQHTSVKITIFVLAEQCLPPILQKLLLNFWKKIYMAGNNSFTS